jgi:uncharacterized membrane protein YfcA
MKNRGIYRNAARTSLPVLTQVFLFLIAALGGALNSVVGGGTFVVFPALLFAGVPPIMANATAAIALWPGAASSAVAYREEIKLPLQMLIALLAASLTGGAIGALLLVRTPGHAFLFLVPWLLLFATLVLTLGRPLVSHIGLEHWIAQRTGNTTLIVTAVQFVIAIYGGYFGAGMGILMLAALTLARIGNVHAMNGVRSLLAVCINGVAQVLFIFAHAIAWRPAIIMIVGATLTGYLGAVIARRINPSSVRRFVLLLAWCMTVYFFLKTYRAF